MLSITINKTKVAVTVKRSARRTTQLKILSPTQIEVRAPYTATDSELKSLLTSKRNWLAKHLTETSAPPKDSVLPDTLLFFGKELPLRHNILPASAVTITHNSNAFTLTHPPAANELHLAIINYYRMLADQILKDKTCFWAEKIGVTYNRVTIKDQKTRWGSCSALRNINYNWRIIQAPDELIDYVVIHELCHLKHLNHSKEFWQLVAKFDPHYMEHRLRLRQIGLRLMTSL